MLQTKTRGYEKGAGQNPADGPAGEDRHAPDPVIGESKCGWEARPVREHVEQIKSVYRLSPHPEGGWFAEVYTAPFASEGRAFAGSIYFLLERDDISHFHQIDCDEIWYFHEGCGLKITVLEDGKKEELLLGPDPERGQRAMAVIPAGAVFAAENLDGDGYTFLSCATTPAFRYEGFRLIDRRELAVRFPEFAEETGRLAFPAVLP